MEAPLVVVNGLPEGLAQRAMVATDADIDAVTSLVADSEMADDGTIEIDREDIQTDWGRPAFDLATESIGVFDGERLIAEAEVFKGKRGDVTVHPDARGRGIGTALLGWTEDLARARDASTIAQTVSDSDQAAADLFVRHGYRYGHTSWVLEIENTDRPQVSLPDGFVFRPYTDEDARASYQVIEDAFNEWPNRDPATFEDWAVQTIRRPSFQPWQMLLVVDEVTDELVGVTFLLEYAAEDGWIQQVATKATHRHRGIARGMLQQASLVFWDRGKARVGVSTDSRTGALGVYEKAGMHVVRSYTNHAKDL
jgi:mycothiol synthase